MRSLISSKESRMLAHGIVTPFVMISWIFERLMMTNTTVIISTYNSPIWLEKVLMGYLHQKTDPFEIIVADDGSDESTKEIIKKYSEISKN